jgi:hypothetical protein
MTVQRIAIILLIMRIISVSFIILVIKRQYGLFKLRIDTQLVQFRMVMFILGHIFLLGNVLPIITDVYYAFFHISKEVNLLVYYAISNALTSLVAAFLLWNIYRIAGMELEDKQEEMEQ